MTFNPEVSTINQRLQFGLETTPGTGVAANKLLQSMGIDFAIASNVGKFTPTGRKYESVVIENSEWVTGNMTGELDYNGIVYALAGLAGAATIGAHGTSSTAKDWTFNPPLTGSVQPQTYTVEQGDSAIANTPRKTAYTLFDSFGYKGDRQNGFTISGTAIAQPLQTAITMTSSPTAIALQPSAGKHFETYLDSTSAGLGATRLTRVLGVDYSWSNLYSPMFVLNRSNIGWTAHVDTKPTCEIKLTLEADATGLNTQLSNLQSSITQFMRVDGLGLVIDNNQTVTLGAQSSGNFTLTYKGQTTGNILFSSTGATVQTALQGLSTIGATGCTVAGGAGGPYTVTFAGPLALDTTALTGNFTGLTTPGNASITQTQVYAEFKHDMAVKVSAAQPFADQNGVYAIQWTYTIVEDATWNHSQLFTCTNLLTAL